MGKQRPAPARNHSVWHKGCSFGLGSEGPHQLWMGTENFACAVFGSPANVFFSHGRTRPGFECLYCKNGAELLCCGIDMGPSLFPKVNTAVAVLFGEWCVYITLTFKGRKFLVIWCPFWLGYIEGLFLGDGALIYITAELNVWPRFIFRDQTFGGRQGESSFSWRKCSIWISNSALLWPKTAHHRKRVSG